MTDSQIQVLKTFHMLSHHQSCTKQVNIFVAVCPERPDQIQLVLLKEYELPASYSVLGGEGGREGILIIPNNISTKTICQTLSHRISILYHMMHVICKPS
jgi:hypothetical protein